MLLCAICGRFPLLLEIYSPTDSTDIHRFYISQYPCSSVQSVGDSLCCLRFILPQIPQIFTDFIYPRIRVHPRYLWEIPSHPISVLIRAICGRFLCCLRFILPQIPQIITDFIYPRIRVHPRYLWEPPSHPISVLIRAVCGRFLCCLIFILPQIPQIFTDFIYPRIRVYLCYQWETPSHPVSVLIRAICGRYPLLLDIYSPTDSTDFHRFYISQNPCSSALSVGDFPAP